MQRFNSLIAFTALTLVLTACGGGMSTTNGSSTSAPNAGSGLNDDPNNGSSGNADSQQKAWSDVSNGTEAQTNSSTSTTGLFVPSGTFVVKIDKARQGIELIIPLPGANFLLPLPVVAMPIPSLPGAVVEQVTQANGAPALGILIPLKYLMKNSSFGDYGTLPNGSPVPFLPFGKVHGFALTFPQNIKYKLHLYMAVNGAAVFIETPDWNLPGSINGIPLPTIGFPIYNKAKTQQVAYLAVVPKVGVYSSGLYVASRIPDQMARMIDDLIRF